MKLYQNNCVPLCIQRVSIMPRQVRKASNDGYYQGYNLSMTYVGNMLTSVRDNASHHSYAGATDFDGVTGREYPLTYNDAGSLVSDAGRKIARIDYDYLNNPVRIQFTNGNVTKYVYSATGEKLRVTYQTAVPNITVAIGSSRELAPSEIQCTDYTDYLLGGTLTLKNGRIDKYQFDEGYCQAEKYIYNTSQDDFTFCYYDQDHLGNIRQVTEADGSSKGEVIQTMRYYPFGAQFCDGTADSNVQSRRYNGKELVTMHGLDLYDYGARHYDAVIPMFIQVDPLAEKYYRISPYVYCENNPVNAIDPYGEDIWEINANGTVMNRIEDTNYDIFYILDENRERTGNKMVFKYGTIRGYEQKENGKGEKYDVYSIQGDDNTTKLFEFLANNTSVEWSEAFVGAPGDFSNNYITTSFNKNSNVGMYSFYIDILKYENIREMNHSHPGNNTIPSGVTFDMGRGDIEVIKYMAFYTNVLPQFNLYIPSTGRYINYHINSRSSDFSNESTILKELYVKGNRKLRKK